MGYWHTVFNREDLSPRLFPYASWAKKYAEEHYLEAEEIKIVPVKLVKRPLKLVKRKGFQS